MSDDNINTSSECSGSLQFHPGYNFDNQEKTLNTDPPFHKNILTEEGDTPFLHDHSSSVQMSAKGNRRHDSYHKTLYIIVAIAIVCSLLAVGLSAYSIVKYNDAASELQIARKNRGKSV